ncbi:MAG: trypsin-like peptidase domain-containing protein [Methylophilaceae bacterium]
MRKLILLLAMLTYIPASYAFDRAKLFDSFFSIVLVRGYNHDGSLAYGSGVIIAPNKVLTNCHVLRQTKEPWVSRGEDSYTITAIQADSWHDICLLTMENLPFKAVTLGNSNTLKKGQETISVGHSSGNPSPVTSVGIIKSIYPLDHGSVIRSTARFALGASGSGLFDGEGRLIGINTFKTIGRNAYFYAVPVEWISYIEKLPAEPPHSLEGPAFWEANDADKPFFLQVAAPELQEDWIKLQEVANNWVKAEPDNSEAWYELGLANEKLDKLAEAETAYRKSVAVNALNTDSLFRLGMLAAKKGDTKEMHTIQLTLLEIDQDIAAEFSHEAGCAEQC